MAIPQRIPTDIAAAPPVDEAVAALRGEMAPTPILAPRPPERDELPETGIEVPRRFDELGPYVSQLMEEARRAADQFRRDTEREVAERAAALYAKAAEDAEAIRASGEREARETVEAARLRFESLADRLGEMAEELRLGAQALRDPLPTIDSPAGPQG